MLWALREGERFIKRLRAGHPFNGKPFPYVVVPELHKDGHVHLHALFGEFVPDRILADVWGYGFVDARRLRASSRGRANGGRSAARSAASYASKYVGKTFEGQAEHWPHGKQRYRVSEGFQPKAARLAMRGDRHSVLRDFLDGHGLEPEAFVWSEDVGDTVPWAWVLLREADS